MYQNKSEAFAGCATTGLGPNRSLTRDFVFLSQNAASTFAAEACIDALRRANRLIGSNAYSWQHHIGESSIASGPICGRSQTLVLVGGTDAPWLVSHDLQAEIRSHIRSAARLCLVSAAVFIPYAAGMSESRKMAVHPDFRFGLRESGYRQQFSQNTTCHDTALSTAISPVAAVQMIAEIIGALEGEYSEYALRRGLGLNPPGSAGFSGEHWRMKRQAQGNPVVNRALDIMRDNIEEAILMSEVADILGVSQRQLERKFSLLLNTSPLSVYTNFRLERSRILLAQTSLPLTEISVACGFSNTTMFRRCYKTKYGETPRLARKAAFRGSPMM